METSNNTPSAPSIWRLDILTPNKTRSLLFAILTLLCAIPFVAYYINPSLVVNLPFLLRVFAAPIAYLYLLFVWLGFAQTHGGLWSWTSISPLGTGLLVAVILSVNYFVAAIVTGLFKYVNRERLGFQCALGLWLLGAIWLVVSISQASRATQSEAQRNAVCEQQAAAQDNSTDLVGSDAYCWVKCTSGLAPTEGWLPNGQSVGDCTKQCSKDSKLYDILYKNCMGEL